MHNFAHILLNMHEFFSTVQNNDGKMILFLVYSFIETFELKGMPHIQTKKAVKNKATKNQINYISMEYMPSELAFSVFAHTISSSILSITVATRSSLSLASRILPLKLLIAAVNARTFI